MSLRPPPSPTAPRALAIGAHPDDVEFLMAGTLLRLGQVGYELHVMNVADGCLGSQVHPPVRLRHIRLAEARASARILGAVHHPPLVRDLEVFYELDTLLRLAAVIREVAPTILLVPSPQDYMEDHTNTCRLAVSAAFVRGMRNLRTRPPRPPVTGDVAIYHAMPVGLCDPLRVPIEPELFVDTTPVFTTQRAALAAHRSQHAWLAETQKLNNYLATLDRLARAVGRMSGRFRFAEGWRRHLHHGFGAENFDPLREALGPACHVKPRRRRAWHTAWR
ncbi:MAG: PIG-L family deacetylase [Kiritimatiellae bacterium]|nr:PIG-L family deacetylase [Kiritimatiellia bacterium]